MSKGEKTKLLWNNPTYRLHMSEVHKGKMPKNIEQLLGMLKGNKYSVGRTSPNKGKKLPWATKEKNNNWKGGITAQDKLERGKFRDTIQKQVFQRDNYTCQLCGISGVVLQVDHIQPWSEYVELRFDINNCRTLCVKCHYKITFGKEMPLSVKTWGQNLKYIVRGAD